jgi:GTPase
MVPVIAIVGRPNVGKSTLFNELTRTRDALVVDLPGVTRDRQYGEGRVGERPFIVIDTGGLAGEDETAISGLMAEQAWQAVSESDIVFFMVDARSGLTPADQRIAKELRQRSKSVQLVVNKTDGLNSDTAFLDFYQLGFKDPYPISASHGRGISGLIEKGLSLVPIAETVTAEPSTEEERLEQGIKLSIVGRPNVGKSTLVNRMLGFERVVVFDIPGTTRDSIYIPLERQGQRYTLIDTAGVRKRARINETVEKFSVVKTLQAIEASNVVILVIDAKEGITDQDLGLLGFIIEAGRALVIAINKWDGLPTDLRADIKRELNYRLTFANFAKVHFISALHGTGVGNLFTSVQRAYRSSTKELSTSKLTKILEAAVMAHAPPMVRGRRIKLRYAHAGGHNPPVIVIHGNQTEQVPETYRRYLMNTFVNALKLEGTPVRIEFKTSENPYKGIRNKLTPRQEYKRKRLREFSKSKKKR